MEQTAQVKVLKDTQEALLQAQWDRANEWAFGMTKIHPTLYDYRVTTDAKIILIDWEGNTSERIQLGLNPAKADHRAYIPTSDGLKRVMLDSIHEAFLSGFVIREKDRVVE